MSKSNPPYFWDAWQKNDGSWSVHVFDVTGAIIHDRHDLPTRPAARAQATRWLEELAAPERPLEEH